MNAQADRRGRWADLGACAAAALVAGTLLVQLTPHGVGITPDSVTYLSVAGSLARGAGPWVPFGSPQWLTHYPPLYPLALAAAYPLGVQPEAWVRALNIGLLGGCLAQIYTLVRQASGSRLLAGTTLAALTLSPWLLNLFTLAWSEPLSLFFICAGLMALAQHLAGRGRAWLALAATSAALAALTRYAAAPLILAAGAVLWIYEPPGRRLKTSLIFCLAALAPIALWLGWTLIAAGRLGHRTLAFEPSLSPVWLWIMAILTAVALLVWVRARRGAALPPLAAAGGLLAAGYGLFVWLSATFLDAAIPLDARLLHVFVFALLPPLAWTLSPLVQPPRRAAALLVVLGVALATAIPALEAAPSLYARGQAGVGYGWPGWRASPLLAEVRALPAEATVYSNAPDAIYYLTGRPALDLPPRGFPADHARLATMQATKGAVAYFSTIGRQYLASVEELSRALVLERQAEATDGVLYVIK